jgi:FtsP/CotA-like multicopper oxidase with cupredoxin domain
MPYPDLEIVEPDRARRRRALTRRQALAGGGVATALGLLGGLRALRDAFSPTPAPLTSTGSEAFGIVPSERTTGEVRAAALVARPGEVDLGGRVVRTWVYGDAVPGPVLRGRVGDTLAVLVDNQLPEDTTVHWHGLAVPNDMDGVPGLTQTSIASGRRLTYRFRLQHPGTYWYHPHVGVQADRGLYGALIVDDPQEPGRYDLELLVVLDDWLDGTGRGPDDVMRGMQSGMQSGMQGGMQGGMGAMRMPSGPRSAVLGSEGGDVSYPHYLLNGRLPSAPLTFRARPGQRARIRIVNAGADTAFRVALGGHRLTVTHSDGFPVLPVTVDTLVVAMGERYDLDVRLGDGAFPLVAAAEGKDGQARAIVRTASGPAPGAERLPGELDGRLLRLEHLRATPEVLLPRHAPDRSHDLVFEGDMTGSGWTINGHSYDPARALPLGHGEVVRLRFVNLSSMFHPVHLHGHTFQVRLDGGAGPRKDTVIVVPLQTVVADLVANNPGRWLAHCHNLYHSMSGMMALLAYR